MKESLEHLVMALFIGYLLWRVYAIEHTLGSIRRNLKAVVRKHEDPVAGNP